MPLRRFPTVAAFVAAATRRASASRASSTAHSHGSGAGSALAHGGGAHGAGAHGAGAHGAGAHGGGAHGAGVASFSPSARQSYIEIARERGAGALLGAFPASSTRYDSGLAALVVTRVDEAEGVVEARLRVTPDVSNAYGTLHGGAIATLVDVLGTVALLARDRAKPGVSVDLNVTYLAPAAVGDVVVVTARALRVGRALGFAQVDLASEATGRLVATGRQTKAFPRG